MVRLNKIYRLIRVYKNIRFQLEDESLQHCMNQKNKHSKFAILSFWEIQSLQEIKHAVLI